MSDDFIAIWNYPLFGAQSAQPVTVGEIAQVLLLVVIGYIISKILARLLERRLSKLQISEDVIHVMKRILLYTLLVIVAMTALSLLQIPLTAFAFVSGAVAIGVGFGAQNILNNFISGWILMFERPVRIKDFIELDSDKGVVEHIGNRSTRIRRTDGVHILVPNSQLLEQKVVNWTLVDYDIRATVRVGVAYGSPTRKVAELIRQAVDADSRIKQEPEPLVVFDDFGDSALIFDVYFWSVIRSERDQRVLRSEVRHRIDEVFKENDIVIAFPQQDVHLTTGQPLDVRVLPATDDTLAKQ